MKTRLSRGDTVSDERPNASSQRVPAAMPDRRTAALAQLQQQKRAGNSSQAAQLEAQAGLMASNGTVAASVQRVVDDELLQGKPAVAQREQDEELLQPSRPQENVDITPLQRQTAGVVMQRRLNRSEALALYVYFEKTYGETLPIRAYLDGLHKTLVLSSSSLVEAIARLNTYQLGQAGGPATGRGDITFAPFHSNDAESEEEQKSSHEPQSDNDEDEASDETPLSDSSAIGFDPLEAEQRLDVLRSRRRNESEKPASSSTKSTGVRASTIRYASRLEEGASIAGVDPETLASRKPHTKLGTGSSGTDHQKADGKAAVRARKLVEAKLRKRQGGAFTSLDDSIRQKEKSAAASSTRLEKREAAKEGEIESAESELDDYKDWLASLASQEYRDRQERLGNSIRPVPPKSRIKKLTKMAKEKNWPTEWSNKYGTRLEE